MMVEEARAMRISWYFGFGWLSILTVVACAVGINRLGGPLPGSCTFRS